MDRVSSGNAPLDRILAGGFPRHSVNIVMGLPGTGKTIAAQQLAFANGTAERPALYLTTLSEPLVKIVGYLQEMRFAAVDRVGVDVLYESIAESLRESPTGLLDRTAELVTQHRPGIVVIDSFKAVMELMPDPQQWRNLVFDLAALLGAYDLTAFWVGEYEPATVARLPEFAVADGILELGRRQSGSRDERFLRVVKLRGSDFLDGQHAFTIGRAGLDVFPRLVGPPQAAVYEPVDERLRSGIGGLDEMIETGWLRGTSTLVAGPSGAGKTMLGLHFLRQGVEDGEAGLLLTFQETPSQLRRVMRNLGWETDTMLRAGHIDVAHCSPVELQVDSIIQQVFQRIDGHRVRRVVVDALGDIEKAAADPSRYSDYVYALTQELAARRITSMLTVEAPGVAVAGEVMTGKDVSYMSDNILLLSMDLSGELTRGIRIIKTRGSAHDGRLHELRISRNGMVVA
jgi:circadian clock protein KaiC